MDFVTFENYVGMAMGGARTAESACAGNTLRPAQGIEGACAGPKEQELELLTTDCK